MGSQLRLADPEPRCTKCGYTVDPLEKGTKLISKQKPTWNCRRCNAHTVQLQQLFGSWPLPEFRELPEAEKTRFWQETAHTKDDLKNNLSGGILSEG